MSVRVRAPASAAPAIPWYLSGGIAAANCLAAYTPKGAASLAASYDNNAAPGNGLADGTYDATTTSAPTFNAATGWTFSGGGPYLSSGVVPASGYSIIVRYSGLADVQVKYFIGQSKTNAHFALAGNDATNVGYYSGGVQKVSPKLLTGVLCIAGQYGYRNGTLDSPAIAAWSATTTNAIYMGGCNGLATSYWPAVVIQAVAIYDTALTAPQVAAITAAMNLL